MMTEQEIINDKLIDAAYDKNLEKIKILLTSPGLKIHAQINNDSSFLGHICTNGDIDTLRYVLTSPDLKEHADVHLDSERALSCAVYNEHIPLVRYLLTSSELKDHSNLHYKDIFDEDVVFEYVFRMSKFESSERMIDYLTLEYAVDKKDAQVFYKLWKYADDIDLKEQIKNNFLSFLLMNKDVESEPEIIPFLHKIEAMELHQSCKLKRELDEELPLVEKAQAKIKI